MADMFSKDKRSEIMSHIKSKDTAIEIIVRKWLFHYGYRYRKNDTRYPGTPDIILPKYKTAIFIHGCFWHRHTDCRFAHLPKTRTDYWEKKLDRNVERDKAKVQALESMGWRVLIIWECELKSDPTSRLIELLCEIRGVEYD
jgi:DNA mismatch endonuclease Vsr